VLAGHSRPHRLSVLFSYWCLLSNPYNTKRRACIVACLQLRVRILEFTVHVESHVQMVSIRDGNALLSCEREQACSSLFITVMHYYAQLCIRYCSNKQEQHYCNAKESELVHYCIAKENKRGERLGKFIWKYTTTEHPGTKSLSKVFGLSFLRPHPHSFSLFPPPNPTPSTKIFSYSSAGDGFR
jgi:hypothetical protein